MMKVVQINAVYDVGSTGRTTREMHEYLTNRGMESYVFTADKNLPEKKVYRIGNTLEHKVHAFLSRIFSRQGFYSYFATKKLVRALKRISPDYVILRNLHSNYINLSVLLKFLSTENIPTILVLHDLWFLTGHCCHFFKVNCNKWQSECHHCPQLKAYNPSLIFDRSRNNFRRKKELFQAVPNLKIIGVSKWTADEARKSLHKNREIDYIYNWIDLDTFRPVETSEIRKKLGLKKTDFVILGVANAWSKDKGIDIFIEIANRFSEDKILLVGQLEMEDALPSNIINVPRTTELSQLVEYYSLADVFINPSLQETFGKVTAEALACGTPVVGSNTTAIPELIPEDCGATFDRDDFSTIVQAINRVKAQIKNGDMSIRSRSFAQKNFDKDQQLHKYIEIINKQ